MDNERRDKQMSKPNGRPKIVAYRMDYGQALGNANAALFLSQATYYSGISKARNGWFWKTMGEWEEELALSRREQETARAKLKTHGLISEQLRGNPRRLFFRVNTRRVAAFLEERERERNEQRALADQARTDCLLQGLPVGEDEL